MSSLGVIVTVSADPIPVISVKISLSYRVVVATISFLIEYDNRRPKNYAVIGRVFTASYLISDRRVLVDESSGRAKLHYCIIFENRQSPRLPPGVTVEKSVDDDVAYSFIV